MNLHEYQAKEILSNHNVCIQRGYVADNVDSAISCAKKLSKETGTSFSGKIFCKPIQHSYKK